MQNIGHVFVLKDVEIAFLGDSTCLLAVVEKIEIAFVLGLVGLVLLQFLDLVRLDL